MSSIARKLANSVFAFGADTKDLEKGLKKVEGLLMGTLDTLKSIRKTDALNTMINAVSLNKLDDLGDRLGSAVNLSSALDSTFAASAKSASSLAASTNMSTKELKQFKKETNVFYDLNLDAQEVQKTWLAMRDAGFSPQDIGFDSLGEYSKFLSVANLDGEKFTSMMEGMKKSFGFSGDQIKSLVDDVTFIGREFNVGAEFAGQMESVMGLLNDKFAKLNREVTPDELAKYAKQVFMTAGALEELSGDPASAMEEALALTTQLTDTQVDWKKLTQGAGDFPGLLQDLTTTFGDFDTAQDLASGNSFDFIQKLGQAYSTMDDTQKDFIDARLVDQFGADTQWLIKTNWDKVAGKLANVSGRMDEAAGTANKMAKAYKAGFTDQELYNREQERFDQGLRKLSRNMGTHGDVLDNQRKAHRKLESVIGDMSKKDGAVGLATRAWLAYRVAGIQGATIATVKYMEKNETFKKLFGENTELIGVAAGTLMEAAPQLLSVLAALKMSGFSFGGLLGPLGLAVGGLAAVSMFYEGGLTQFMDDAGKFTEENLPKLTDKLASGMESLMDNLPAALKSSKRLVNSLTGSFVTLMEGVDWESFGKKTAPVLADGMIFLFDAGVKVAGPIADAALKFVGAIMGHAFDYLSDPSTPIAEKVTNSGKMLGGMLLAGMFASPTATVGISKMLGKGAIGGGKLAFKGLAKVGEVAFKNRKFIGRTTAMMGGVLGLGMAIMELPDIWASANSLMVAHSEGSLSDINDAGFDMASSFYNILNAVFFGIPGMIGGALGISKAHVKGFYDYAVLTVEGWIGESISAFKVFGVGLEVVYSKMKFGVTDALLGISIEASDMWKGLVKGGLESVKSIEVVYRSLLNFFVEDFFAPMIQKMDSFLMNIIAPMKPLLEKLDGMSWLKTMSLEDLSIAKASGMDAESIEKRKKKRSEVGMSLFSQGLIDEWDQGPNFTEDLKLVRDRGRAEFNQTQADLGSKKRDIQKRQQWLRDKQERGKAELFAQVAADTSDVQELPPTVKDKAKSEAAGTAAQTKLAKDQVDALKEQTKVMKEVASHTKRRGVSENEEFSFW